MKTLYVENVSLKDIMQGNHIDPTVIPCILIRILDPGAWFERVKYDSAFKGYSHFFFSDTDEEGSCIEDWQARMIAKKIVNAKAKGHSIIVHCTAGLCRSGAVTDVAMQLGFQPVEGRARTPNVTVRRKLMQNLGLDFDPSKSAFVNLPPVDY